MFGAYSIQGRRPYQQDAMCEGELLAPGYRLFGIFDGHGGLGGERCAKLATTQLRDMIKAELLVAIKENKTSPQALSKLLTKAFADFDDYLKTLPRLVEKPNSKKRSSFVRMFLPRLSADFDLSGSCACVVLSTPKEFIIANLGDSRAVLSDGKRLTNDHNTMSKSEFKRVCDNGGYISKGRVYGVLCPTRAFGDFQLKGSPKEGTPVTCVPEITVLSRKNDMPKYMMIMCDGITGVLNDKELADFCEGHSRLHPREMAECVVGEAFKRKSTDNLSVIVVRTNVTPSTPSSDVSSCASQMSVSSDESVRSLDESPRNVTIPA